MAIIGGGYTGLAAARALARHGADVTVLERHTIGWGASSRNGGFVLPGFKPDVEVLARPLGLGEARRLFELSGGRGATVSRRSSPRRASSAGTPAAARSCSRPVPAIWPGSRAAGDSSGSSSAHETRLLGPADLRMEIGSERYHGGLVDPFAGSVQPAALVHGLAAAAERAGARLCEGVDVRNIARGRGGFEVATAHATVAAREVLVATNGYTGSAVPALRRRVVPVGSYLIATAPLDPALARTLIPRGRVLSDTKNLLYYFRLSPDRRMVFGGRAAFTPTPVARSAEILTRGMLEVFPELAGVAIEYAWGGQVAFTLDQMPHAGRLDGVHYALGYAGHGVALATWLGARMGDALAGAGKSRGLTAPFPRDSALRRDAVVPAARRRVL